MPSLPLASFEAAIVQRHWMSHYRDHTPTPPMNHRRQAIPDPVIVPLPPVPGQSETLRPSHSSEPTDLRRLRVEEFLQARSLAPKSQQAYRQDLCKGLK